MKGSRLKEMKTFGYSASGATGHYTVLNLIFFKSTFIQNPFGRNTNVPTEPSALCWQGVKRDGENKSKIKHLRKIQIRG